MQDQEPRDELITEIVDFLRTWQLRLGEAAAPGTHLTGAGRAQAELLRARAAERGLAHLVYPLARCSDCFGRIPLPMPELRSSLRAIAEIAWHLRERGKASAALGPPRTAEPIPACAAEPEPPPLLCSASVSRSALQASASPASHMPAAASPSPLGAQEPFATPPPSVASPAVPGGEHRQRASPGLLATLFGLRAFGHARAHVSPRSAALPARAPSARASSLLGFGSAAPLAPPLVTRQGALPQLPDSPPPDAKLALDADLDQRLRQLRPGAIRWPHRSGGGGGSTTARSGAYRFALGRWSGVSWAIVLGVMVLGGVLLGRAFLVLDRRLPPQPRAPDVAALALEVPVAAGSSPATAPAATIQQFQELVVQVHGWGGQESPELAVLLNAEAHATYRALSEHCEAGSQACEGQRWAQELIAPRAALPRDPRPASAAPPRWLAGLKIPAIGAHNDPEVQRWLEYYTSHSVGRELFQTMLFRCGAHQDLIDKTLVHYGLPDDLLAVVLTESGCVASAESAVGARGLWQFMAPTARAYHLHVQEGVLDERLSPVKATEAAVKYLADLYRKLGSWEMAFASYNAGSGPFRMLARLQQAGGSATFWDLAKENLIPEETARYVPRIQAYALILANLRHFDFSTAQLRTTEETADLEVPSRARLGQVARAAGTSVAVLRSLNPDLVGTVIPRLPDNRFVLQVPKATAHRARETLGQFLLEQLDQCVPSAFDWGRERFTVEMQTRCAERRSKRQNGLTGRSNERAGREAMQ
jgi:hypothetical protein